MGTWGNKIKQDDFVRDVIDSFISKLKETQDLRQSSDSVLKEYTAEADDPDDGPLLWLGLAEAQWQFGSVTANVLAKVKNDFAKNRGLDRWEEQGQKAVKGRKREIEGFIQKIESPNPKPKKLPKLIIRKPVYEEGDCLSISLNNGLFAAAIVLSADNSELEYGKNLIGLLNFLSEHEATPADFEKREWLTLTHHSWKSEQEIAWYVAVGHRKFKDMFKVVGKTVIRRSDPQDARFYQGWGGLGEQVVIQREWDKERSQQSAADGLR